MIKQDVAERVFNFLFLLETDTDNLIDSVVEKEEYLELACSMANDELIYITWFEHDNPSIDIAPKGEEMMKELKAKIHSLFIPSIPKSIEFVEQWDLLEPPSY